MVSLPKQENPHMQTAHHKLGLRERANGWPGAKGHDEHVLRCLYKNLNSRHAQYGKSRADIINLYLTGPISQR